MLARFSKEQDNFIGDIRQISINIGEGHTEKYNRDGSGFLDVLYRHATLLEHTLELHKIVVARNMALVRLQAIILCLQKNNEKNIREVAYLAAVRNGILKGYVEQSRKWLFCARKMIISGSKLPDRPLGISIHRKRENMTPSQRP